MRGAGKRGQWADRITHTLDVEAPGEYTGRPTPARALRRPPPLTAAAPCATPCMGAVYAHVFFTNPNGERTRASGVLSPVCTGNTLRTRSDYKYNAHS